MYTHLNGGLEVRPPLKIVKWKSRCLLSSDSRHRLPATQELPVDSSRQKRLPLDRRLAMADSSSTNDLLTAGFRNYGMVLYLIAPLMITGVRLAKSATVKKRRAGFRLHSLLLISIRESRVLAWRTREHASLQSSYAIRGPYRTRGMGNDDRRLLTPATWSKNSVPPGHDAACGNQQDDHL